MRQELKKLIGDGVKMVVTPDITKDVQKACFKHGIKWEDGTNEISELDKPYLYVEKDEDRYAILCSSKIYYEDYLKDRICKPVDALTFINELNNIRSEKKTRPMTKQEIWEELQKNPWISTVFYPVRNYCLEGIDLDADNHFYRHGGAWHPYKQFIKNIRRPDGSKFEKEEGA